MAGVMLLAAQSSPQSPSAFRRYLAAKPLSYWVMTWFLFELVVLTAIGTFFRGPGWAWVWPWQGVLMVHENNFQIDMAKVVRG